MAHWCLYQPVLITPTSVSGQGGGHRQIMTSAADIASLSLQTCAFLLSSSPLIQYLRQKGSIAHTMTQSQLAFL